MKKTVFLLSFVVVSAGVLGMTNVRVNRGNSVSSVNLVSIEKNNFEPKLVLQRKNTNKIKQRIKDKQLDYDELIFDLKNKSLRNIKNKCWYKVLAKEM